MSWEPIGNAFVFAQRHEGDARPVGQIAYHNGGFLFRYANSWLSRPDSFAIATIHQQRTESPPYHLRNASGPQSFDSVVISKLTRNAV